MKKILIIFLLSVLVQGLVAANEYKIEGQEIVAFIEAANDNKAVDINMEPQNLQEEQYQKIKKIVNLVASIIMLIGVAVCSAIVVNSSDKTFCEIICMIGWLLILGFYFFFGNFLYYF